MITCAIYLSCSVSFLFLAQRSFISFWSEFRVIYCTCVGWRNISCVTSCNHKAQHVWLWSGSVCMKVWIHLKVVLNSRTILIMEGMLIILQHQEGQRLTSWLVKSTREYIVWYKWSVICYDVVKGMNFIMQIDNHHWSSCLIFLSVDSKFILFKTTHFKPVLYFSVITFSIYFVELIFILICFSNLVVLILFCLMLVSFFINI